MFNYSSRYTCRRVSKRLGIVSEDANVKEIEEKLMNIIPKDKWNKK